MAALLGSPEELLSCLPGDRILDWYSDDNVWHERVLIWKGASHHGWYVLTPDLDLYEQSYALDGQDGPEKFKIKGRHFTYYSRVQAPVYKFATEPTEADMRGYIETALDEMGLDVVSPEGWRPSEIKVARHKVSTSALLGRRFVPRRITRGLGVLESPVGGPDGLEGLVQEVRNQVSVLRAAPDGFMWAALVPGRPGHPAEAFEVAVESGRGIQLGEDTGMYHRGLSGWIPVFLLKVQESPGVFRKHLESRASEVDPELEGPPDAKDRAGNSAEVAGVSEGLDARALEVDYNAAGERHKAWDQLVLEAKDYQFDDWPLEGPLSTAHLLRHFSKFGGDPKRWLSEWMRTKQVSENDRTAYEMRTLIDCIYTAGVYDQLNIPALASLEIISRRIQGIVDAFASGTPGNPDWASTRVITNYRGADDAISPALRTWAARRNKEEMDLAVSRARVRDHRRGLQVSVTEEAAATAVADGVLPNGGAKAKVKPGKGRGRGLSAPDGQ